jgi:hypothetical protein
VQTTGPGYLSHLGPVELTSEREEERCMSLVGLAVVLAVVFLVLAAVGVVGWVLALVVAVVAVLAALLLGGNLLTGRRL